MNMWIGVDGWLAGWLAGSVGDWVGGLVMLSKNFIFIIQIVFLDRINRFPKPYYRIRFGKSAF